MRAASFKSLYRKRPGPPFHRSRATAAGALPIQH
jgi:hypothetical protein